MGRTLNDYRRTMILMILFFVGCAVSAGYPDFFAPFKDGEAALDSSQRQILDKLRSHKSHELVALVKINESAVGQLSVNFNLTADKQFRASHMTTEQSGIGGRLTWKGNLDEGAGSVLLTKRDQNLTGTISTRDAVYQVRPLGSGVHALVRLNPAEFPPDHPGPM